MIQSVSQLPRAHSLPRYPALQGESATRRGPALSSFTWLAVAGVLLLVSNGRWIVPAAAWLGPIFVLRFIRTQGLLWGICCSAVVITLAALVSWWGMVPVPGAMYVIVVGAVAQGMLVPFVVDRLLSRRLGGLLGTLVLPSAWVSVEFLTAAFSPYGSWGAAGYTQFGNLPLLQMVSITGVYGIGFLMAWFAAVVNYAWERGFEWGRVWPGVSLFGTVTSVVFLAGGARLAFFRPEGETVRVGSITAPDELRDALSLALLAAKFDVSLDDQIPDVVWQGLADNARRLHEYLAEQTRREARAGAQMVFWPEGHAVVTKECEGQVMQMGREIARSERIFLGMGLAVARRSPPGFKIENRLVFLDPQGEVLFDYTKQFPVPGFEAAASIIPVRDFLLPVVDTPHGRVGAAICFDMDFPWFVRQAGQKQADVILVPASDWRAIDPLHTQMALLRGIESGCSVIRQTNAGLSAAVDSQGRLLASMDHFTTPGTQRTMVTHVPVAGIRTVYARVGDLFSWLCMGALVALTCWSFVRRPSAVAA